MDQNPRLIERRTAATKILSISAVLSVWSAPVLQAVVLPVHAQTSLVSCGREDIPGRWRFELFGLAASVKEVVFLDDGTTEQSFVSAWQYVDDELTMARGVSWLLRGRFLDCDVLYGTYTNLLTIPFLGNIVIREGEWRAQKLSPAE